MQDRFRFRAWDKKLKCYRSNVQNGSFVCGDCSIIPSCVIFDDDRFVVEQCTGLKDKNNKPIYEGDIIKYIAGFEEQYLVKWDNNLAKFILNINGTNAFKKIGFIRLGMFEIIGNIHENPELIKRVSEEQWKK